MEKASGTSSIAATVDGTQPARPSRRRLTAEVAALNRLHALTTRLLNLPDLGTALAEIVDASIDLLAADIGSVQLYDASTQMLSMAAQRGFDDEFVERVATISASGQTVCSRALKSAAPVVVKDLEADARYEALRELARRAGYRAVMCIPLTGAGGEPFGVLSAYFRLPHAPRKDERRMLELYAQQASMVIARVRESAQLRQSEERFRAILNQSAAGVVQIDEHDRFVLVNQRFCEMLGYCEQELLQMRRNDVSDPAHVSSTTRLLERLAAGGVASNLDKRYRRKDGSLFWANVSANALRGPNGEQRGFVAMLIDIDERRNAELRDSFLVQLDDATRAADDPLEITGTASRMLGLHLAADRCVYAEVDHDETHVTIVGDYARDVASLVGRFSLASFGEEALHTMREGEAWIVDDCEADPRLDADSRRIYRLADIRALIGMPLHKAGRFVAGIAIHQRTARRWSRDEIELAETVAQRMWESIERARVARELRESERQFRTLADSMPQLAWMARPDGTIYWFNQRCYDYTGFDLEELQGWGWISAHDPALFEGIRQRYLQALEAGEPWEDTFPIRARNGGFGWFLSRALPVRDGAGRIVRWFGTNTDITAQRAAEEALREADRRKDEFLATLAHELRNPLAPIRNAVALLGTDPEPGAIQSLREILERQVNHLVRLVDDLIEISRISRGTVELRRESVSLIDALRAAVETARPLMEARGHRFEVALSPMTLDADPVRVSQIVTNLLNNAAKYTDEGGVVGLEAMIEQNSAVITVRDTGIGMAPETIGQVFQMFAQVDRTRQGAGGLGIGLALVKNLVELHGGQVQARSRGLGHGSEFIVRLPLAKSAAVRELPAGRAPAPVARVASRVLVVDDNLDSADSLGALLTVLGAEVVVAYDGPAALEIFSRDRPAAVFLDIGMPGMDGFEVARRLRSQSAETMLIALTGWGQEDDRRRTHAAGFDRHLVKPVDVAALDALLNSIPSPAPV
ncbi:MAG: PAS domain S-box protein [Panacagrimonas sp.]